MSSMVDEKQLDHQKKVFGLYLTESRRIWDGYKKTSRNVGLYSGLAILIAMAWRSMPAQHVRLQRDAAVLFGSAKTGERVHELFRLVDRVQVQMRRRVETPRLSTQARRRNFDEVEKVLSVHEAAREARRCLRCDLEWLEVMNKAPQSHA